MGILLQRTLVVFYACPHTPCPIPVPSASLLPAAIPKSRTSAVQNAALAHAVRQVEDAAAQAQAEAAAAARAAQQQPSQSQRSGVGAPGGYDDDRMDVDQDQDAAPHDSGGWSGGDGGGGGSPYGEGEGMAGGEDDGEVYGSPVGFSLDERSGAEGGGGFGGEEEEERGAFGGLGDEEEGGGWQQPVSWGCNTYRMFATQPFLQRHRFSAASMPHDATYPHMSVHLPVQPSP